MRLYKSGIGSHRPVAYDFTKFKFYSTTGLFFDDKPHTSKVHLMILYKLVISVFDRSFPCLDNQSTTFRHTLYTLPEILLLSNLSQFS